MGDHLAPDVCTLPAPGLMVQRKTGSDPVPRPCDARQGPRRKQSIRSHPSPCHDALDGFDGSAQCTPLEAMQKGHTRCNSKKVRTPERAAALREAAATPLAARHRGRCLPHMRFFTDAALENSSRIRTAAWCAVTNPTLGAALPLRVEYCDEVPQRIASAHAAPRVTA